MSKPTPDELAALRAHAAARRNHRLALLTGDPVALAQAADDVERAEIAISAAQCVCPRSMPRAA